MANQTLTQTSIKVDNIIFDIEPNSFKYKFGYGEKETFMTLGPNGVIANLVHKPETKRSTAMFNVVNTAQRQEDINTIFSDDNLSHTIQGLDPNGNIVPLVEMAIINDPEFNSDGSGFELSFEGPPAKGQ